VKRVAEETGLNVRRGEGLPLSGEALSAILSDVLGKGLPFRFKAKGFSMSPFLKDGDVLTVSPLPGLGPRTGDIVAFRHPKNGLVAVHRIVRRASGVLVLKGDNSPEADGPLPAGSVLGIVTAVERSGRPVRLGSGTSRAALALFSRAGVLAPLLRWVRGALRRETRRG
jgi:hypothetical protein